MYLRSTILFFIMAHSVFCESKTWLIEAGIMEGDSTDMRLLLVTSA